MAKVFRLHQQGIFGTGWFDSKTLSKDDLKTIKTEGKDVATSIPSPFARIDLVKSAFRWVADNGINGNTAQHRLVSDSLDIGQLFYRSQKHKDKIKIIAWSPKDRFQKLIDSTIIKHSKFAETLKIYWEQDSVSEKDKGNQILYNFEHVKRLFFLLNKDTNQIIGGTSPATLFIASPDVRKATSSLNIMCGHDKLFDEEYASLAKREESYVEYLFALAKQPGFSILFPEVYAYLEEVRKNNLTNQMQIKVSNLTDRSINDYPCCPVLDNINDPCEVLGIPLGIQTINGNDIEQHSDFVIKSDIPVLGQKPLVIPTERFTREWTYTTHGIMWDPNAQIESKNIKKPEDSILPIQGDKYYWLTTGNFLEDKIIELPYTVDDSKFINCGSKKYLLPLTPTYFKYFNAEKVHEHLKIEELSGGGVEVKLEIPVKSGKILLRKKYHSDSIEKLGIHLAILPFLKTNNFDLEYNIGVLDTRTEKIGEVSVEFFEKGVSNSIEKPIIRSPGELKTIKSTYYKSKTFDTIRLSTQFSSGHIVPNMPLFDGNKEVHFAIDFGTTNTHIEYKSEPNAEKSFDITPSYPIWQSLIDLNSKNDNIHFADNANFEREILPYLISDETQFKFPFRTALAVNHNINYHEPIELFRHVNNYFLFEKRQYPPYLDLRTQLKWSNYSKEDHRTLVECYITELLYMALIKTILIDGDPRKTKFTWFYPVSMDDYELNIFYETWEKAYKKVFKTDSLENISKIPESVAPYLFYKSMYPGLSLSIDIGGGSSDIAVFEREENFPKLISSFKFAGNAIFGDGFPSPEFRNNSDSNGFVKLFLEDVKKAIQSGSQRDEILNDIVVTRKDSSDFSSFLFSLENEPDIVFSYSTLLRKNKRIKLPILIFYAALAFYSAKLLQKSETKTIPKNILLSGTASKTALMFDTKTNDYENLSKLFTFIFNKIFKGQNISNIKIALTDIPKQITCKGALKAGFRHDILTGPIMFWLGGKDDAANMIWDKALNKDVDLKNTPRYHDIEDNASKLIEESILEFYSIMDDFVQSVNLNNKYGIEEDAYDEFKKMRSENIIDFLRQGLKSFYKNEDHHISETLFFYPLIGILNKLAFNLSGTQEIQ